MSDINNCSSSVKHSQEPYKQIGAYITLTFCLNYWNFVSRKCVSLDEGKMILMFRNDAFVSDMWAMWSWEGPQRTCEASWVKTASKLKVLGAAVEEKRLWAAAPVGGSQKVSCFLWASTFRKDMDSDVSWSPLAGQIRTITLTCRGHGWRIRKF